MVLYVVMYTGWCCAVLCSTLSSPLAPSRYLLELKKEHRAEFLRKVTGMAERIGFKVRRECPNCVKCANSYDKLYLCMYICI